MSDEIGNPTRAADIALTVFREMGDRLAVLESAQTISGRTLSEQLHTLEHGVIKHALEAFDGSITYAARSLGMSYQNLNHALTTRHKNLNIAARRFVAGAKSEWLELTRPLSLAHNPLRFNFHIPKAWHPQNWEEACKRNAGRKKLHQRKRKERADRIVRLLAAIEAAPELLESSYGWLSLTAETMKRSKATACRDFQLVRRIHPQFGRMFGKKFKPKKDQILWSWDWSHYGFRTRELSGRAHKGCRPLPIRHSKATN